ncbi:Transposase [uncultured Collinsella sp.]|nr:Transposase [uncultured Collinsella sp.]
MGKPCPKHTAEFKRRAVQPCNERGTACAEVAREAGVDPSGLADWARRASAAAPGAEADPFQTAGDLRRLRRGNERLKRENEMLSKASAFLAGRQL